VFILDVGAKWVLGMRVEDGGYLNGYLAFRLGDVTRVTRDKTFAATTAKILPGWPPRPPVYALDLSTTAAMIDGFGNNAAIVGLETQGRRSELWVGQIDAVDSKRVWLRELDVRGDWLDDSVGYRLREVTSVAENSRYLRAIAMVAAAREVRETKSDENADDLATVSDPAVADVV
jgi:hypothetical protein